VLQTALKQNNFLKISISDKIYENKVDGKDKKNYTAKVGRREEECG